MYASCSSLWTLFQRRDSCDVDSSIGASYPQSSSPRDDYHKVIIILRCCKSKESSTFAGSQLKLSTSFRLQLQPFLGQELAGASSRVQDTDWLDLKDHKKRWRLMASEGILKSVTARTKDEAETQRCAQTCKVREKLTRFLVDRHTCRSCPKPYDGTAILRLADALKLSRRCTHDGF